MSVRKVINQHAFYDGRIVLYKVENLPKRLWIARIRVPGVITEDLRQRHAEETEKEGVMICINPKIPHDLCEIDDELKAIYHSKDTGCIWVFKTREDRSRFMDETAGMQRADREHRYEKYFFG